MKKHKYPREMVDLIVADKDYFLLFFAGLYIKTNDIFYLPKLRKNGDYTMKCPLHTENTPSFRINAKTNLFKCFGCGRSGSNIHLIEEVNKISFLQAIRYAIQLKKPEKKVNTNQRKITFVSTQEDRPRRSTYEDEDEVYDLPF